MKTKTRATKRAPINKGKSRSAGARNGMKGTRKDLPRPEWMLRLYVAGQTPRSLTAFANLKKLCEEHLADHYVIEVVDLTKQPQLAQNDQIVALPTLVRKLPEPIKRVIGDLSNFERVMVGMDLKPIREA